VEYPDSRIEADTGKYTFVRSNLIVDCSLNFSGENSCHEQLGFDREEVFWSGANLECTNVINLQPESTLFIHSNLVHSENSSPDILQEIYASSTMRFDNITFESQDKDLDSKKFSGIQSNIASFLITDENNEIIDTNGINVLITLLFYNSKTFHQRTLERISKANVISQQL
jgi:hypothetical protein